MADKSTTGSTGDHDDTVVGETVSLTKVSGATATIEPIGAVFEARPADRMSSWPGVLARLQRGDLAAGKWWLLTRLALLIGTGAAAWLLADGTTPASGFVDRWLHWDAIHFDTIALYGYDGTPTRTVVPFEAFFPGQPLAVQPLIFIGINSAVAGMIVAATALLVGMIALRRLGDFERGAGVGERAVVLLLLSPWAMFLLPNYSEALFIGFAIPAWLAAKRDHWWLAGLLGLGAATTRVSGLFLALALLVQFAMYAKNRRANWPAVAIPFLGPLLYTVYQYDRTGDWRAWQHAQEEGWDRTFTMPWDAVQQTWDSAFGNESMTNFIWMWRAELIAGALAIVVCVWLLVRRQWPELVYVGGQTAAFFTSSYLFSVPRAFLLWWPVWIGIAAFVQRRPQWWPWILAVFVPLQFALAVAFTSNAWAG